MANSAATEFLKKVLSDEALKARLAEKSPGEAVTAAAELGFEVTEEELLAAEQALRNASGPDVLELDETDMDRIAGGADWHGDDAPDGHEMGCEVFYHGYNYSKEEGVWCKREYYKDAPTCSDYNRLTEAALCRKFSNY